MEMIWIIKMKPKKVKCPVCESILEYGNEDVEKEKIPCTGFIINEYITFPICNEEIVLKSYFKEGDIKWSK